MPVFMHWMVIGYLLVALGKFILVMPSIPVAIAASSWYITREKGVIVPRLVIMVPLYWAIASLCWWVPRLASERWRFFFSYKKRDVIRDALEAHRWVAQQAKL